MSTRSPKEGKELDALDEMIAEITDDDLDLSKPAELAVLSVKEQTARCRWLGCERVITLRASRLWEVVPGAIVTVKPGKQWRYAGHPSGITKSVYASASCLWETTLPACCPGAISTTGHFCAACMAMVCVSGVLGALTRRSTFLIGCSG